MTGFVRSFNVVSIDPGFVHMGMVAAVVTVVDDMAVVAEMRCKTLKVCNSPLEAADTEKLADSIDRKIGRFLYEKNMTHGTCLIEKTWGGRGYSLLSTGLKSLEIHLYHYFTNDNWRAELIAPSSVKRHFAIATKAYASNKSAAVAFANSHLASADDDDEDICIRDLDSHQADCVNQLYYWLTQKYPAASVELRLIET